MKYILIARAMAKQTKVVNVSSFLHLQIGTAIPWLPRVLTGPGGPHGDFSKYGPSGALDICTNYEGDSGDPFWGVYRDYRI